MKSSILSLNKTDFIKGLIVAVLTAVITIAYNTVQAGTLAFDWKAISIAAISSALAYIMKNLFTNSSDEFLKADKS